MVLVSAGLAAAAIGHALGRPVRDDGRSDALLRAERFQKALWQVFTQPPFDPDALADDTIIHRLAGQLMCAAQYRVRRAAKLQAMLFGCRLQGQPILEAESQRLFGIDMFSRLHRRQGDGGMGRRHREVQHNVDVG